MTRRQAGMWAGVVLGALLVGCGTMQSPVDVPQQISKVTAACLGDAQDIGPEGGMLSAGVYTLTIPPGALAMTLHLTMEQETCGEWPVQLGPEGTQFAIPATLEFDASAEPNPEALTVAWWNPSTQQWVDQTTEHDGTLVSTHISHFSRWVLH